MRKIIYPVFSGVLLCLGLAGQSVLAQQPAAPPQAVAESAAYAGLYDAILAGIDEEQVLDQLIASFSSQLMTANPDMVKAEAAFPGFSAALGEGMRPLFKSYRERVRLLYRPRMIAELGRSMTPAEALDAGDFYRSALGRKLLGGVSDGFDGKATTASALRDKTVDPAALNADIDVAATRAVERLTPADIAEFERMARTRPVLYRLDAVTSGIDEMNLAMQNEPLTAPEQAEMKRAVNAAIAAHIAKYRK